MKILVCCAGGMSSSLLVSKMRDEVRKQGLTEIKIGSCPKDQITRYLDEADIILVAPQISFISEEIEKMNTQHHTQIMNISAENFGKMDATAILEEVLHPRSPKEEVLDDNSIFRDWLSKRLTPLAHRISLNRFLNAISSAFTSILPVTMIGSLFTLLSSLPFNGYSEWLSQTGLNDLFSLATSSTIDLISLYLAFFITYHYVRSYQIDGHPGGLLSLICFFIVTGRNDGKYALTYLGSNGLFGAIFVALSVGWFYVHIYQKNIRLHLPDMIPRQVASSLEAIVPSLLIIPIYVAINGFTRLTPYGNFHTIIYQTLQTTLTQYLGNNIFSFLFFQIVCNLLWFFGIHGGNTISAITNPIYLPLALENFALYQAGQQPIHIISSSFSKCFISGGVGSMFSLSILMVTRAKSQQYKTLGKLSLPTTFFFINEPLLFGIPIIMNPLFFIPLIFITPFLAVLTYLVMKAGLIPIPIGVQLPWATPPVVYGLLQGSWKIAVWEVFMIFIAGCIWYPFFKIGDRMAYQEEHKQCHN